MATNSIAQEIYAKVVDNKAIAVGVINDRSSFRLLGATMATSVNLTPKFESEKTIVLYPNKGEEGVVAIVVNAYEGYTGGKNSQMRVNCIPVFLKVSWTDGGDDSKPHIDLNIPWFATERVGGISTKEYPAIEVAIKSKRFSSLDAPARRGDTARNTVYGVDGNLLCRYLWGTASRADVLHAAVQSKVEPLAVERVEEMTNQICVLENEIRLLDRELASLRSSEACLREILDTVLARKDELHDALQRIPRWFRPKSVNKLIDNLKP